ncbi:MAG: hypothetical protein SGBAC_000483 [Bacillariaceae sp.]
MTIAFPDGEVVVQQVPRWKLFQNQKHSLRIPVSEIASCVGYHPYRDLVQLALRQVYQGSVGQELLGHDAKLLGLRLESEEELLMEIAEQAGKATKDAWKAVVQVQNGDRKVESVEQAQTLSKAVLQRAKESKKLSRMQLQQLEQASKHNVNTGFGTCWEDQALDMYEKQLGTEVRARNEVVKVWPFVRADNGATVRPLKEPYCHGQTVFSRDIPTEPEPKRQKNDEVDKASGLISADKTTRKQEEYFFSLRGAIDGIRDELVPNDSCEVSENDDDDSSWVLQPIIVECKHRMNRLQPSPPLYEMIQIAAYCKMYDAKEGDLLQVLRKNKRIPRTGRVEKQSRPAEPDDKFDQQKLPFAATSNKENKENDKVEPNSKPINDQATDESGEKYERITSADTNASMQQKIRADKEEPLVVGDTDEVLGTTGDGDAESVQEDRASIRREPVGPQSDETSGERVPEAKPFITVEPNEKENVRTVKEDPGGADKDTTTMEISVSRISMDDSRYQLNHNWESMILPRLKSWVEGIYEIRTSDDKRYRLLIASSSSLSSAIGDDDDGILEQQSLQQLRDAWNILFQECPWLVDCDTQYSREIRVKGFR